MAIYKPPKARWPLAIFTGVAGLLLGIGIGLLLGADDPDPAEGIRIVQQELAAAAAALEVAGIEYTEAVDAGEVVNDVEYEGSLDALESSRERFESISDALAALAPDRAESITDAYDAAAAAMEATAPAEEVQGLLDEVEGFLKGE